MSVIAEMIYREAQRLPEHLAREVYDFLRFVEARHGIEAPQENPSSMAAMVNVAASDWQVLDPSRELAHLAGSVPMEEDGVAYQRRIRDQEWP